MEAGACRLNMGRLEASLNKCPRVGKVFMYSVGHGEERRNPRIASEPLPSCGA